MGAPERSTCFSSDITSFHQGKRFSAIFPLALTFTGIFVGFEVVQEVK